MEPGIRLIAACLCTILLKIAIPVDSIALNPRRGHIFSATTSSPIQGTDATDISVLCLPCFTAEKKFSTSTLQFPLILRTREILLALSTWGKVLTTAKTGSVKDDRPIIMISAPTGSGKTHFLHTLCNLFEAMFEPASTGDDSILQTPEFIKLMSETKTKSFIKSTEPCFVTFNQDTPVSNYEVSVLQGNPVNAVIARMFFAETLHGQTWDLFLEKYAPSIVRIQSVEAAVRHLKNLSGRDHFMLAIDELLKVEDGYHKDVL